MSKEYFEKFKDPRWQKKRLEILERDEWRCRVCGDKDMQLNVHHTIYYEDTDPWKYANRNLITLCEACHEEEHECFLDNIKQFTFTMRQIGFLGSEMYNFCEIMPDGPPLETFKVDLINFFKNYKG